jgi:hypothetical protein
VRPWSRRSPRALRCGTTKAGRSTVAPLRTGARRRGQRATRAGPETRTAKTQFWLMGSGLRAPVARAAANASSSRRPVQFARPELERIALLCTGALVTTFRRAAPARCGAFAEERRAVAATQGGGVGREGSSKALGRACASLLAPFAEGVREERSQPQAWRSGVPGQNLKRITRASRPRAPLRLPLRCARAVRRVCR